MKLYIRDRILDLLDFLSAGTSLLTLGLYRPDWGGDWLCFCIRAGLCRKK